jgi:K+-transporting ATPase ATPase C chain
MFTQFRRQLLPGLVLLLVFTLGTGVAYPLIVTAIGQSLFRDAANGSLVKVDGVVVGSTLLGQPFQDAKYFHPRPSAAGNGYDGASSGGSNLGPDNPALLSSVADRVKAYRAENGLADSVLVPVDAVTASASGLDPEISVANARLQAPRVASARGMSVADVLAAIDRHTTSRPLGVLGDPGVNVLELNLALDGR